MSKRSRILLLTFAAAAVVVAGGLWASNMGFKLNYPLDEVGGGTPGSAAGLNTVGLPYNRQAGINDANDLGVDMGDFFARNPANPVDDVRKYIASADAYEIYQGALGQTPFGLNAGEGNFVKVNTHVDYVIVGSHAPGTTLDFYPVGGGPAPGSAAGLNLYAPPYHTTNANSNDTGVELGDFFARNPANPVDDVRRYIRSADAYEIYQGALGQTPFPVSPGEAYFVKVNTAVTGHSPSHF